MALALVAEVLANDGDWQCYPVAVEVMTVWVFGYHEIGWLLIDFDSLLGPSEPHTALAD